MKKIVAIVFGLAIGVAILAPAHKASAYPIGGGYGNQCFIPAVQNWCWVPALPLGAACYCNATGATPGYVY